MIHPPYDPGLIPGDMIIAYPTVDGGTAYTHYRAAVALAEMQGAAEAVVDLWHLLIEAVLCVATGAVLIRGIGILPESEYGHLQDAIDSGWDVLSWLKEVCI